MKKPQACIAPIIVTGAALGFLLSRSQSHRRVRAGQVAIITGSSRGLGLALAHRFGKAGLKLVLTARNADELNHALDDLLAHRSIADRDQVLLHPCDLKDSAAAPSLIAATFQQFGRLDLLINNAGIIQVGPAENQPVEAYREAMQINFFAALYCIYAALPQFLRQRSGAIVNISSIGGKVAVPHLLPYVAAKFALTGLSEGLHAELRHRNIRVTTVCPGLMRTGGEAHAQFRGQAEKEKAWFQLSARTPFLSANVHHAANKIFHAVNEGRAEITITPQAWLAARLAGLAPEKVQQASAIIHRYALPNPATPN